MKLRYLLIILNLCLLLVMGYCYREIQTLEYHAADLPELNDRYQSVLDGLESGVSEEALMSGYDCVILLTSSSDYTQRLYDSIDHADVILDYTDGNILLGKIIFEQDADSFDELRNQMLRIMIALVILVLCVLNAVFFLLYYRVVGPFQKLQKFAANIAIGNFDLPLYIQKKNYFGAFTESFDVMREELKKAREGELQANRSKKELVASLSHDVKTPVATIKALCEILEIKLAEDENIGKLHTIHQKADLIDSLISNMFHATLSELEVLKINPTEVASTVLSDILQDMNQLHPIRVMNDLPRCLIICDTLRLTQVIDNLLSNSYKYAGTEIQIHYLETKTHLIAQIRDFGDAVEDLDLALVCEKFYRGSNASAKAGSGLGLYLAKQFMEGMGGSLICEKDNGFIVTISLKKVAS